jgi:hypothetical protein
VWKVVSKIRSAGGSDIDVSSPVGEFMVSSSPDGVAGDVVLNQLEEMLGSRYRSIFQQIRNGGFKVMGESYMLNDSKLTQSQLMDLLNQLREHGDSIDVTFE